MTWICPYCQHSQIFGNDNNHVVQGALYIGNGQNNLFSRCEALRCLNSSCNQTTLFLSLHTIDRNYSPPQAGDLLKIWRLMPESAAKPQPEYIPLPLREDYEEACRIRDLSPKASATLARRCLQGMIRDFCKVAKGTLDKEIKELKRQADAGTTPSGVTHETIDAIDHVRSIGNIGAHMEKDIDLIVDIDPGEAQILIELVEMLFEEWYIARETRKKRLASLKQLADDKRSFIEQGKLERAEAKVLPPADPS